MTPEAQRLAIRGNGGQGTNGVKVSKPTCRTNPCGPLVRMLPEPCHASPDTAWGVQRKRSVFQSGGVVVAKRSVFQSGGVVWWWLQAHFWATAQAHPYTGVRGQCQAKRRHITGDGGTVRSAGMPAQRVAPFGCRQGQAKRQYITGDGVGPRGAVSSAANPRWSHDAYA